MRELNQEKKVKHESADASAPFLISEEKENESLVTMEYSTMVNGRKTVARASSVAVAPAVTKTDDVLRQLGRIESRRREKPVYDFCKRGFDIVAASLALVVFAVPMLFCALLVRLTSRGPVLFRDVRVGRNGKEIHIYKFRTMYKDAEARIRKYLSQEEYEQWLVERKIDNDPRVTKVGKFLRKTSLDELPQLFNILGGSISVIGPRPIARYELECNYTPVQQNVLLSCKPGLSGLWAASGRSEVTYEDGARQKLELAYVKKRGFFFDLYLIVKTVFGVLRHKGAK